MKLIGANPDETGKFQKLIVQREQREEKGSEDNPFTFADLAKAIDEQGFEYLKEGKTIKVGWLTLE